MQNRKLKAKIDYKVLGCVMKYIIKNYKFKFIIVLICIVLATASSVAGDLYLQTLIDDYIVPLVGVTNPIYTGLIHAISFMIGIYLIGVIASFLHSRFMVYITEGVIKTIRAKYPNANISPVDYDPGASEANQTNRLKLLMTVAKDNLNKEISEAKDDMSGKTIDNTEKQKILN